MKQSGAWEVFLLTNVCSAAGSFTQEDVDPQERKGALWDTYRRLVEKGWTPDVHSYTTSFRPVLTLRHSVVVLVGLICHPP